MFFASTGGRSALFPQNLLTQVCMQSLSISTAFPAYILHLNVSRDVALQALSQGRELIQGYPFPKAVC